MRKKVIVLIRWPDGRQADIGVLDLEYTKDGMEAVSRWNVARRFGWAMVKQGIIMMIRGSKDENGGRNQWI